jgi:regulatory protein
MPYLTHLQKEQVQRQLQSYCTSSTRSHFDVRQKLTSLGLWKKDREEILSRLIASGHLDEMRFAQAFVARQERRSQWGRHQIKRGLAAKNVSAYNIQKAVATLDDAAYRERLMTQAKTKWHSVKGPGVNLFVKMSKTRQFLLQRGYEYALINEALTLLKTHQL